MKVLVIEDDEDLRESLALLIKLRKHKVETFDNAEDALERVLRDRVKFDRVICDVKLPGMSGLNFLQNLRRRTIGRKVRVVMITGHVVGMGVVADDLRAAYSEEDETRFEYKPFDADEFMDRYIESWPHSGP